jgi:C-terminal processing protease CtpA/Prc
MMKHSLLTFVLALSAFSANAKEEKVFCDSAIDAVSSEAMNKEYHALLALGYEPKEGSQFMEKFVMTHVGTGLKLAMDTKGIIAVDALPGSPADKTGLFEKGLGYGVQAVDGIPTGGKSIEDVMRMIRGDGIAGKGLVITFNLRSRDRNFDRFLERKRITTTVEIPCVRMVLPNK